MPPGKIAVKNHIVRHADGSIRAKGRMAGGVMTGYWKWFRKDGTIMRSGCFENGRQVGKWTTYDRTGNPFKVTEMNPAVKRGFRSAASGRPEAVSDCAD